MADATKSSRSRCVQRVRLHRSLFSLRAQRVTPEQVVLVVAPVARVAPVALAERSLATAALVERVAPVALVVTVAMDPLVQQVHQVVFRAELAAMAKWPATVGRAAPEVLAV